MQTWMVVGQWALLVLGVPLVIFAVVMAIFAGGEGSPGAQNVAWALLTIPVAYLVCLIASAWLSIRKRGGAALSAAAFPFLYTILAFLVGAAWPTPS